MTGLSQEETAERARSAGERDALVGAPRGGACVRGVGRDAGQRGEARDQRRVRRAGRLGALHKLVPETTCAQTAELRLPAVSSSALCVLFELLTTDRVRRQGSKRRTLNVTLGFQVFY